MWYRAPTRKWDHRSWSQNNDADFSQYEVHKAITAGFTPDPSTLETTIAVRTQTSFTVQNLTPNQTYYFKVRVVNTSQQTADSNEVSAATFEQGVGEEATFPTQNAHTGAMMGAFVHSGEFRRQETDLVIKGRGFDFKFISTYRSRIDYSGPLGVQWDFNYNVSISKDVNCDALVQNGEGRIYRSLNKRLTQTREVDNLTDVTTTYEYDGNQNLKRILKPEGNDITAVYDERDLLYTIIKGAGAEASTVTVRYTLNGKRSEIIDGNNNSKTLTYDSFDRVIEIIGPLNNKAEVAYDAASNVTSIVRRDSTGLKLSQRDTLYDEINRTYQIDDKLLDGQGNITDTVTTSDLFDKKRRRTKVTDDNGNESILE